jgi:hypothetical protein
VLLTDNAAEDEPNARLYRRKKDEALPARSFYIDELWKEKMPSPTTTVSS